LKRLLLIIILTFVICNLTFVISAAQEPYLWIYWILGSVDPLGYPNPNGQKIYFDNAVAKDIIGPSGESRADLRFAINAGLLSTLEAGRSYDVFSTYSVPPNFYHIGPSPAPVSGKGYDDVGTLVVGEGMGEIPGVDDLKIERVGATTNYKLSWNSAGSSVNVYRITTTDAASLYDDSPGSWGLLIAHPAGVTEYQIPDDQIGDASRFYQAYYKLVLQEFDTIDPPYHDWAVMTAEAVGKHNFDLYPNFNLVSLPLKLQSGDSIDAAFPNQLRTLNTEVYVFNEPTQGYTKALYTTDWSYTGELGIFPINSGKAYWIYNPASRKTVSLLGGVRREAFTKDILPIYNLVGSPRVLTYPSFTLAGLPALVAREGDEAYVFDNATQLYSKMKIVGGVWQEAAGGSEFKLIPTLGYWYYNGRPSPFGWTINP